jgi:hypothetical protein
MRVRDPFLLIVLAAASAAVPSVSAWAQRSAFESGQGFMVKPMRMEAMAAAGQTLDVPFQIRNIAGDGEITVNLRLVELSETVDGGWKLIEPDAGDTSGLLSSRTWTHFSANQVKVNPLQPSDITVHVAVPASARGVYFAGIVAETPPVRQDSSGISVRVRFLVPLIVSIQGRPVRQQVSLTDVLMASKADPGTRSTTTGALRIVNTGRTFSRVRGSLRVERENKGVWRPVTKIDVTERGIIPGATLELGDNLRRSLPSGTYRLHGELYVDGRRVAPFEREVDFTGAADADEVAYDTALLLSPPFVNMDVVPGASRTTTLKIENPGDTPVNLKLAATIPSSLIGVEMGKVRGDDFSAADWTRITPSEFTIGPGRTQNVRVISTVPTDGVAQPNYYADLTLDGAYSNGQSAGTTHSTIHLVNRAVQPSPDGIIDQLQLAEGGEPLHYVVQMRVANTGNVDVIPTARADILNPQGQSIIGGGLSGDEPPLLPLGKRTYSGELDLSKLAPGTYALHATAVLASGKEVTAQRVLKVEPGEPDGNGGTTPPVITVVKGASVEAPAKIDVPGEGSSGNAQ